MTAALQSQCPSFLHTDYDEAGEEITIIQGCSGKLSAVATGHTMHGKEKHYEKVGEDFELVHESYRNFHPVFVEEW